MTGTTQVQEWRRGDSPRHRPGVRFQYLDNLAALGSAQKPPDGTAAYSRLVNRRAARYVAAAAEVVGLAPNAATALSAGLSGTALVLLATVRPTWWLAVAVPLLLAAGYVMDSVDGQLARLDGSATLCGEYLDHTIDLLKVLGLHLAVLVSWHRFPAVEDIRWLLVPMGFLVVHALGFHGLVTLPLLRRLARPSVARTPASPPCVEHPLRAWLILPTDYGVFCWSFVLVAWPVLFVAGYTAMFAVNALLLLPMLRKWWRELVAIDGPA